MAAKAKKRVKTKANIAAECCAPICGDYKPRLYLALEKQDVSQVKGLTVGEEIEVVVRGKVVGLEQREREEKDYKTEKVTVRQTGEIQLEGYRVEVLEDEENVFTQLSEEDE